MSLGITNVRILQEFGIVMGVGIAILFIITIIVMPIMLSFIKPPSQKHINRLVLKKELSFSFKILGVVKGYPKPVIFCSIALILISGYGLTKIDSDVNILGDLKPGNKLSHEAINNINASENSNDLKAEGKVKKKKRSPRL